MVKRLYLKFLFCILFGISGATGAAVISVGTPTTTVPPYLSDGTYLGFITVTLAPNQFLLPVEITGALNLPNWQFDLIFNNTVVREADPLDGTSGIYGARFSPPDPNSLSFILGGFPFNQDPLNPLSPQGRVDDVAGEYPFLLDGVTGDGVLAFILFEFVPGQETANPGFGIENAISQIAVPEPNTLALFAGALLILTFTQRRFGRVRLPKTHGSFE